MTLDIRTFSFLLFLIFEYVYNTVFCVLCSAVKASAGPNVMYYDGKDKIFHFCCF